MADPWNPGGFLRKSDMSFMTLRAGAQPNKLNYLVGGGSLEHDWSAEGEVLKDLPVVSR